MSTSVIPITAVPPVGKSRRKFSSYPLKARIGAIIVGVFVLLAIFGPYLAPFDPSATKNTQAYPVGPNWTHLLSLLDLLRASSRRFSPCSWASAQVFSVVLPTKACRS